MWIYKMRVHGFRNLISQELEVHPSFNVLSGENGQGKTNLLESIYVTVLGKGFRYSKPEILIHYGKQQAQIDLQWISDQQLKEEVCFKMSPEDKLWDFCGKSYKRAGGIGTYLKVMTFSPDSTTLFRGPPAQRRKYLDHCLCNFDASYGESLGKYERCLQHRNRLLKAQKKGKEIDVFSGQLAELACRIDQKRREYLSHLLPFFKNRFEKVGRFGFEMDLCYSSLYAEPEEYLRDFKVRQFEEYQLGYTLTGPHRSDFTLSLGQKEACDFASQGQHRLLILSLLLAELDYLRSEKEVFPIFLLDDLGSELDEFRLQYLIQEILSAKCQCFLTTTGGELFKRFLGYFFTVKKGEIFKTEDFVVDSYG